MSQGDQEIMLHFAEKAGDIFLDSTPCDVLMVVSDSPASGAILAGFTTTGASSISSMIRMDTSNLSLRGNFSATSLVGPSFSNIDHVTYTGLTSNAGSLSLGGDFYSMGFSNVLGSTYANTTSNAGSISVGGALSVTSDVTVLGTLVVQRIQYPNGSNALQDPKTDSSNLTVAGWFSNAGSATIGGVLTASSNVFAHGFSNVGGQTFTTTLSNAGNMSVVGALAVDGNILASGFSNVGTGTYTISLYNAGTAVIEGVLTAGSDIRAIGFSNVHGQTYTTTLSNAGDTSITGALALQGNFFASGFSNVGTTTYVTALDTTGAVSLGGTLTTASDILATGFSNASGVNFTSTLSNAGDLYVGGGVSIASDLTVGGTLIVKKVEYAYSNVTIFSSETINSNLSVNGWLSNVGSASVGGSLTVGQGLIAPSNILASGFSNIQGVTYTSSLLNAGNISTASLGVGVQNPMYQVDVAGDIRASGSLIGSGFRIVRNSSNTGSNKSYGNAQSTYAANAPSSWNTSNATAFILGSNVGIGTSNPVYPLDVAGGTRLTGGVFADGFSNTGGITYASNIVACLVTLHGSDYAEYMHKADPLYKFDAGSVVGVDSRGFLTKSYKDSIQYGIKTTSPCIVGGDEWSAALGSRDSYPHGETQWDADYGSARNAVDQIAYCGRLPVGVYGSVAGDYIIPTQGESDTIIGMTVKSSVITFDQFKTAIGRVVSVADDGRAIVKVMCG